MCNLVPGIVGELQEDYEEHISCSEHGFLLHVTV